MAARTTTVSVDTQTLLRIFGGCARTEISRHFLPNSCVASTAITIDVMNQYGRAAQPWEVCARLLSPPYLLELGCHPPESQDQLGGHLVSLVEGFLVDASFGQITNMNPMVKVPPVFVGELQPRGAPVRNHYQFNTPFGTLGYEARPMSRDYRLSLDWGPSPERDLAKDAIIAQIEVFCQRNGLQSPNAAT